MKRKYTKTPHGRPPHIHSPICIAVVAVFFLAIIQGYEDTQKGFPKDVTALKYT